MPRIIKLIALFISALASAAIGVSAQTLQNNIVDLHLCGLDYMQKSVKITNLDSAKKAELGEYYVHGAGLPCKIEIDSLPDATECNQIVKAYLWMTYSHQVTDPDSFTVEFTNPKGKKFVGQTEFTGSDLPTGWGRNDAKYGFRVDVTDCIDGNGTYIFNANTNPAPDTAGNALHFLDGVTLLIVYRQVNADYQGHLLINDGIHFSQSFDHNQQNEYIDGKYNYISDSVLISGLNVCEATSDMRAFMLVSDLQTLGGIGNMDTALYAQMDFNGNKINVHRHFWNFETYNNIPLTAGQNYFKFSVQPSPGADLSDKYTIGLVGIYYRTKNCFACSGIFESSITATGNTVCTGTSSVKLSAVVPDEFINQAKTFEWTSDPAGFTSTDSVIEVSPSVNTTYTVKIVLGNGCLSSTTSYTVYINPKPVVDAGPDVAVCDVSSATLTPTVTGGTEPYSYKWEPATGLSDPTIKNPVVTTSVSMSYTLTVVDANGCIASDTVSAVIYTPPSPSIIVIGGDTAICFCDSVTLAADKDYAFYNWSTNENTKSITVRQAGKYYLTVKDTNGCPATSLPVEITTFTPRTTVSLNDTLIYAKPGDIIAIPLKIKQEETEYLNECKLSDYIAKVSFDKSVLLPVEGTPFGEIIDPDRVLTLTGSRNGDDTLLTLMKFKVFWGDTDYVDVRLDTFAWLGCNGAVEMIDSAVKVIDLCYAGGTRLFNSDQTNTYLKQNYPNPANDKTSIEFGILERSSAEIDIYDIDGRLIKTYKYPQMEPGRYVLDVDAVGFSAGTYIYSLKVGGTEIHRIMTVTGAK